MSLPESVLFGIIIVESIAHQYNTIKLLKIWQKNYNWKKYKGIAK